MVLTIPTSVAFSLTLNHHYVAGRSRTSEARKGNWKPDWDNEFSARTDLRQLSLPDASYWPLKPVPVVRLDETGERELVECEWGLLPLWWKPSAKTPKRASFQRQCFNAKSETADAKPAFRDAFKRRRCLLPAVEFFEKGHYFHRTEREPFAFAGLWERWHAADGETFESCTLLTTEPNELVKSVGHHRMPVLLTSEGEYAAWLNPEVVERGPLEAMMRPIGVEGWGCERAEG